MQAIHQLIPHYSHRDAIGEEATLLRQSLQQRGFLSEIYTERPSSSTLSRRIESLSKADADQALFIYHHSIYSKLPLHPWLQPKQLIIRYHNVTPAEFFPGTSDYLIRSACYLGRLQNSYLESGCRSVIADSAFNLEDFSSSPPDVMRAIVPVLRDYRRLSCLGAPNLPKSNRKRLLFVGRMVPNKAQDDLIRFIGLAQKVLHLPLQLILIGSPYSPQFAAKLREIGGELGLRVSSRLDEAEIVLLGSTSDEDMAALYRGCDGFICWSEHEGFCVPLVEAMFFELPILAHAAAAVPEVLGPAGLLVDKRRVQESLEGLKTLLLDDEKREDMKRTMRRYREQFDLNACLNRFMACLDLK